MMMIMENLRIVLLRMDNGCVCVEAHIEQTTLTNKSIFFIQKVEASEKLQIIHILKYGIVKKSTRIQDKYSMSRDFDFNNQEVFKEDLSKISYLYTTIAIRYSGTRYQGTTLSRTTTTNNLGFRHNQHVIKPTFHQHGTHGFM